MSPVVKCLLRKHRALDSIPSIKTTTTIKKNNAPLSDSRVGDVKIFEDRRQYHCNSLPTIRAVILNRKKGY